MIQQNEQNLVTLEKTTKILYKLKIFVNNKKKFLQNYKLLYCYYTNYYELLYNLYTITILNYIANLWSKCAQLS